MITKKFIDYILGFVKEREMINDRSLVLLFIDCTAFFVPFVITRHVRFFISVRNKGIMNFTNHKRK